MKLEVIGAIRNAFGRSERHGSFIPSEGRRLWSVAEAEGVATVRLRNGKLRRVDTYCNEAHGIGKRDFKIKDDLDKP